MLLGKHDLSFSIIILWGPAMGISECFPKGLIPQPVEPTWLVIGKEVVRNIPYLLLFISWPQAPTMKFFFFFYHEILCGTGPKATWLSDHSLKS